MSFFEFSESLDEQPKWVLQQCHAYLCWLNIKLANSESPKQELSSILEMSDGVSLLYILKVCENKHQLFTWNKEPKTIYHQLENIDSLIAFLKKNYKAQLTTVSSEFIVSNPKLNYILGLVWSMISIYQIKALNQITRNLKTQTSSEVADDELPPELPDQEEDGFNDEQEEKGFLLFVESILKTKLNNLTELFKRKPLFKQFLNSFTDLDSHKSSLATASDLEYYRLLFDVAYKTLKVPKILDETLLDSAKLDTKSLMLYLSFFKALKLRSFSKKTEQKVKKAVVSKTASEENFKELQQKIVQEQNNLFENLDDLFVPAPTQSAVAERGVDLDDWLDELMGVQKKPVEVIEVSQVVSSSLDPFLIDLIKPLKEIKAVSAEIIETEKVYVNSLQELKTKFIDLLPSMSSSSRLVDKNSFGSLVGILNINTKLLNDLTAVFSDQKIENRFSVENFALFRGTSRKQQVLLETLNSFGLQKETEAVKLLKSFSFILRVYASYAALQGQLSTNLATVKSQSTESAKELRERVLSAERTLSRGLTDNYLILPIQRIGRYVLLIREFGKLSRKAADKIEEFLCKPNEVANQTEVTVFLSKVRNELSFFVRSVKETENMLKETAEKIDTAVLTHQKEMEVLQIDKMILGKEKFMKVGRVLVKKGYLKKISAIGDIKYYFVLFNDCLAYFDVIKRRLLLHKVLPINLSFTYESLPDDINQPNNRIAIKSSKKSFIVYADKYQTKMEWTTALESLVGPIRKSSGGFRSSATKDIKNSVSLSVQNKKKCAICTRKNFSAFESLRTCSSCNKEVCKTCYTERRNGNMAFVICAVCNTSASKKQTDKYKTKSFTDIILKETENKGYEQQPSYNPATYSQNQSYTQKPYTQQTPQRQQPYTQQPPQNQQVYAQQTPQRQQVYAQQTPQRQQSYTQQPPQNQQSYYPNQQPVYYPQQGYYPNPQNYQPSYQQPPQGGNLNYGYKPNPSAGKRMYMCPFCKSVFTKADESITVVYCASCGKLLST